MPTVMKKIIHLLQNHFKKSISQNFGEPFKAADIYSTGQRVRSTSSGWAGRLGRGGGILQIYDVKED